ncbi:hypothetical protein HDV62DRAFT_369082 [Trichoderma sp. SZMC 28011]
MILLLLLINLPYSLKAMYFSICSQLINPCLTKHCIFLSLITCALSHIYYLEPGRYEPLSNMYTLMPAYVLIFTVLFIVLT